MRNLRVNLTRAAPSPSFSCIHFFWICSLRKGAILSGAILSGAIFKVQRRLACSVRTKINGLNDRTHNTQRENHGTKNRSWEWYKNSMNIYRKIEENTILEYRNFPLFPLMNHSNCWMGLWWDKVPKNSLSSQLLRPTILFFKDNHDIIF